MRQSRENTGTCSELPKAALKEHVWSFVAEVDFAAWEQVRDASDVFMDLRLLQAIETSMSETCRFRYVLYRDTSGEPVAIAVLCVFGIDVGVLVNDSWFRWFLASLRRISPKLVQYRILFCGLPLSACQSSLRFASGADHETIANLFDQTMRRVARQDHARVIILKEFADDELPQLKTLETLGYRKAESLPTHLVHLKCDSFDGYVASVGSKRRTNIRHSLKKFAASGIRIVTTSDIAMIERLFSPETYKLYESVLSRSATKLEHLPREFFLEVARQIPDCCEFSFAVEGERVLAFSMSLWAGHEYRGIYLGYDEVINPAVDLYFNTVFQIIANAAIRGATVVELGQNSHYFKRTKLGAVQSRRSIYVRGVRSYTNWAIGLLFSQLFPPHPLAGEEKSSHTIPSHV